MKSEVERLAVKIRGIRAGVEDLQAALTAMRTSSNDAYKQAARDLLRTATMALDEAASYVEDI